MGRLFWIWKRIWEDFEMNSIAVKKSLYISGVSVMDTDILPMRFQTVQIHA